MSGSLQDFFLFYWTIVIIKRNVLVWMAFVVSWEGWHKFSGQTQFDSFKRNDFGQQRLILWRPKNLLHEFRCIVTFSIFTGVSNWVAAAPLNIAALMFGYVSIDLFVQNYSFYLHGISYWKNDRPKANSAAMISQIIWYSNKGKS